MPNQQYQQFFAIIDQLLDDEPHDSQSGFIALLRDRIETDPAGRDAFVAWSWEQMRPRILQVVIRRVQEQSLEAVVRQKEQSQHDL
jgi:hypothetical protein